MRSDDIGGVPRLLESRSIAGWNALHETAWADEKKAVDVLVELGADANARVCDGKVPIDVAKGGEKGDFAEFLKALGGSKEVSSMYAVTFVCIYDAGLKEETAWGSCGVGEVAKIFEKS